MKTATVCKVPGGSHHVAGVHEFIWEDMLNYRGQREVAAFLCM